MRQTKSMKIALILILLIGSLGLASQKSKTGKSSQNSAKSHLPSDKEKPPKWSLKYLGRASNFLMVLSDQYLEKSKPLCDIPKNQLGKLQKNLRKTIDKKIESLSDAQKTDIIRMAETCEKSCACDTFSYYFDRSKSHEHKSYSILAAHKSQNMSDEERLACAKSFKEFCTSDLFTELEH